MGLWTKTHAVTILPAFAVYVALAIVVAKLLKNKSDSARWLPFRIMAALLLAMEVIKQVLAFDEDGYGLYTLPFHYCSLLLYLYPLHAFGSLFLSESGKAKGYINTFALMCGTSLVLMMLVMPDNIYSDGNILNLFDSYGNFHTVFFHHIASFYAMLMIAMQMYKVNTKRDLISTAIFLSSYVIIATVISYALKTNFHNLYRCNIDFIWDIVLNLEKSIGVMARVIYVAALFVLTTLIAYAGYFLTKLVVYLSSRLCNKSKNQQ